MNASTPARASVLAIALNSLFLFGKIAARDAGRRAAATLAGYLAVALLFATSLSFLTFSAVSALAEAIGNIYAGLVAGCVYLLAGLIALLVLQARRR